MLATRPLRPQVALLWLALQLRLPCARTAMMRVLCQMLCPASAQRKLTLMLLPPASLVLAMAAFWICRLRITLPLQLSINEALCVVCVGLGDLHVVYGPPVAVEDGGKGARDGLEVAVIKSPVS